ncbi:MAG: hypothetical protein NTZ78_13590 [Candidatus Aureabacteria bacterium]|nr:hypothetical protein [Candidatus Auribacterota bacterium]
MRKTNLTIALSVFVLSFACFFLKNHYYLPSTAEIIVGSGNREEAFLFWDSGKGFSEYEKAPLFVTGRKIMRFGEPLLTRTEGVLTVSRIPLPQLPIRALKIEAADGLKLESLAMESANGRVDLPLQRARTGIDKGREMVVLDGIPASTVHLHPLLFTVHLLLALIFGYLAYELAGVRERFNQPDWRSTLAFIFFRDGHWLFWDLFTVSFCVFSLWLLGQWPGVTDQDALWNWQQSIYLDFHNYQPFIYSLFFLFARQVWDSPAFIALLQITAMSALGSYIFYFVMKYGRVRFICILPFYAAFLLSIPVGYFNVTILKDVPFAILMIFWAFLLYYAGYRKMIGKPVIFTLKGIVLLSPALVFCTLRHSATPHLIVIPLLFALSKGMPVKRAIQLAATSIAIVFVALHGVVNVLCVQEKVDYRYGALTAYGNPLIAMVTNKYFWSPNPKEDIAIFEKWMTLDYVKAMQDKSDVDFWWSDDDTGGLAFCNLPKKEKDDIFRLYLRRMPDNLPLILAERVQTFVTNLGFYGQQRHWNVFPSRGAYGDEPTDKRGSAYCPLYSPKSAWLNKIQNKLVDKSWDYRGIRGGRFIFWNMSVPLVLLIVAFLLNRWLPLSALFSLLILLDLFFLFAAMPSAQYRYMYFLHLAGFFIIPLAILEIASRTKR